jgi:hypothetical protein
MGVLKLRPEHHLRDRLKEKPLELKESQKLTPIHQHNTIHIILIIIQFKALLNAFPE